jgi:outer membrane protein assembly factor BamB
VIVGSLDGRVYILNGKYGDTLRTYIVGAGISSSPALGDIDDDGKLEIVVGAQDHKVHAINNDASLLWSYSMINDIESSPAIGDIDKNGDLEVVVGCENGKVYALDGNGDSLWTYLTGSGVKSSPALGDVDGDTKLEIVVGSKDNKVYCLNGETGSLLWSYTTGSSVNSSPALGDIDGDNELEAVFGSSDNKIYALNGLGLGTEEITYGASPNSRLAMQCQPNPFKRTMVISYSIPRDGNVALKIYDATGRLVVSLVDGKQSAGYHEVSWDFSRSPTGQLPNGVYFSRLETDDLSLTEKVIMVR